MDCTFRHTHTQTPDSTELNGYLQAVVNLLLDVLFRRQMKRIIMNFPN